MTANCIVNHSQPRQSLYIKRIDEPAPPIRLLGSARSALQIAIEVLITTQKWPQLRRYFDVDWPPEAAKDDVWPGYSSVFIRRHTHADVGDDAVPNREVLVGRFGLIPHWSRDDKISSHTYNARAEKVMEKPSFRYAWRKAQHCIIPAEAIYEPDWRSGKAITTRIESSSGEPLGIAGLWSTWRHPSGEIINSFTMLTINADDHPLMRNFHRPKDEKRMVVILAPAYFDEWLNAKAERSARFLIPFPSDQLRVANAGSVD